MPPPDIYVIENSGTKLTDYQVMVELKGSDFPAEAKSDGADIRFTDTGEMELSYWIEDWDGAGKTARIWVKIPEIPFVVKRRLPCITGTRQLQIQAMAIQPLIFLMILMG